MVSNTINATYTETYDLNTAIGELSILGIHTPQADSLKYMFKGFFEQYKKYKILGCNLQMVCATQQSLTPDLVGLEAGQVDPRDVLNPILFKACTGENLNVLLNQIYNSQESINNSSSSSLDQHVDNHTYGINAYYSLLADDSFRREHPQKGLTVMGLKPMVHKVVTTQPFGWSGDNFSGFSTPLITPGTPDTSPSSGASVGFGGVAGTKNDSNVVQRNPQIFVSNGMTDMPWLDTVYDGLGYSISGTTVSANANVKQGMLINSVPRVYMGCIVLPPAILQRLFFRMQIVWHIQFKDFRPACEIGPIGGSGLDSHDGLGLGGITSGTGNRVYWNLYHSATDANLTKVNSSFDSNGLSEITTVNEKVR